MVLKLSPSIHTHSVTPPSLPIFLSLMHFHAMLIPISISTITLLSPLPPTPPFSTRAQPNSSQTPNRLQHKARQLPTCRQQKRAAWFPGPRHQPTCYHALGLSSVLRNDLFLFQKAFPLLLHWILFTLTYWVTVPLKLFPLSQASLIFPLIHHCHHQRNIFHP